MKRFAVAASMVLLSAHAVACPMSQSLAEQYGISFSGFKTAIRSTHAPDTMSGEQFVRVAIPDESNVSDGFRHTVVMDTKTKKAWILRTGGFLYVYQWFGPIDVINDSLKDCRLEPTLLLSAPEKTR